MSPARALSAVALLALLGAACGGSATAPETSTAPVDGASVAPSTAPDPGSDGAPSRDPAVTPEARAALDFSTIDTTGAAFEASEYAGQDTVLWIWAPWCSTCNREAPGVRDVVLDRGSELNIFGLAGKDTLEAHQGFVAKHQLELFRHAVDPDGGLWAKYGVGYQPAFVFINDDGTTWVHPGAISAADFHAAIDQLLST